MEALLRNNLIENNFILDFNNDLKLEELLDIISKIKFKENIDNKVLTKKLEK